MHDSAEKESALDVGASVVARSVLGESRVTVERAETENEKYSGEAVPGAAEAQWRPHPNPIPIVALVGPTASGKTKLSIELAYALGGPEQVEIISADAMQLYRGMDIGTAKVSDEERQGIVHHQIDVLDVVEEASVAVYQRKARADIERVMAAGKIPLLVGGSGLYVSAVLDELNFPGTDAAVRGELERVAAESGLAPLIGELQEKDPRSAATIDLANPRRVIRALEVVRITGRSYTPLFPRHTSHYQNVIEIGLRAPREFLDPRIDERTRRMFSGGLIDETRALLMRGLRSGTTAQKATGYAQALGVIEGKLSVEEAIEATVRATQHLAKKQRTWFAADRRIQWYEAESANANALAQQVRSLREGMK
ncbi:MAG: tRNA (adenosine(37)-N6)-dimethylallyltransferase MiaA [Arcanobacterium sp.]|nr:tRNA (adenosine(37)-N6)-dimethylallyltransferase MiaA [Arcanobacterium sp.]